MRHLTCLSLLMLTACEGGEPPGPPLPPDPEQPPAVQRVELTTFSGATACADLEQHLEDRAVLAMTTRVERSRKWALQSWEASQGTGGGTGGLQDSGVAPGGSGGGAAGGGTGSGPTDYTTTNTQEVGIDEPDFVKNDGTRLFVLSGRRLYTATTWPVTSLATRGSLALPGRPLEMFLEGNRLIIFSGLFDPAFDAPSWCQYSSCQDWYVNTVLVTHVDVSDLANPVATGTQRVPGRYESARRVGEVIRLVTTSSFPFVDELPTWVSWEERERATSLLHLSLMHDRLILENTTKIRARTLAQWLPSAVVAAGSTSSTTALDCTGIWTTNASARLGLTNIVSLDLGDPLAFSRQALLAAVDELYQGPDGLYLAQRHWWWWSSNGLDDATYVYRFDVSQPDRVHFAGAGRLDGKPLNQFSFDEHQGVLRVATTQWTQSFDTVNRVVTLGLQQGALVELGRTEDLAPGERIMSARFVGELGYVVTFRQVDPLYVIDLSDPTRPRMVGELKIPGFSSYIHPLDATHLLTIGTYIPEPPATQWTRHLQLQIFDVSDPTRPRQTHTELVGEAWGWSEAQWDHKAFNYFAARGTLAIPFADWYQDEASRQWRLVSDLRVYQVDAQAGFTLKGRMDMADVVASPDCTNGYGCWSWYWQPNVRRSVMADDFVYAISSGGVRVAHVDSLSTPIATARFDPAP